MRVDEIVQSLRKKVDHPEIRVGDTLRVHVKIAEGEKERVQIFEGMVIKKRRGGDGASFTVRKISYGIGVERIFPLQSPSIDRIELVQRGKVRRARLFYLRGRKGRDAAIAEAYTPEPATIASSPSTDEPQPATAEVKASAAVAPTAALS